MPFCILCEDPQASPWGLCHYHPGRPIQIFQTFYTQGENDALQWSCCGKYVPPDVSRHLPPKIPPKFQGELRDLIFKVLTSDPVPIRTKEACSKRPHKFECRVAIISDQD